MQWVMQTVTKRRHLATKSLGFRAPRAALKGFQRGFLEGFYMGTVSYFWGRRGSRIVEYWLGGLERSGFEGFTVCCQPCRAYIKHRAQWACSYPGPIKDRSDNNRNENRHQCISNPCCSKHNNKKTTKTTHNNKVARSIANINEATQQSEETILNLKPL